MSLWWGTGWCFPAQNPVAVHPPGEWGQRQDKRKLRTEGNWLGPNCFTAGNTHIVYNVYKHGIFIIVAGCCPWPLHTTRQNGRRNCVKWREGKAPQQAAGTCGVSFAEKVKIWAEQTFYAGFSGTGESLFNKSPLQRISWSSLWHIISASWHFGSSDNLSSQPADHCSVKFQNSPECRGKMLNPNRAVWCSDTKELPGSWPWAELTWGCAMGMLPWPGCPAPYPHPSLMLHCT